MFLLLFILFTGYFYYIALTIAKFAKILGKENVRDGFFGQEINLTTYNLARINMFLHNINYNNFIHQIAFEIDLNLL